MRHAIWWQRTLSRAVVTGISASRCYTPALTTLTCYAGAIGLAGGTANRLTATVQGGRASLMTSQVCPTAKVTETVGCPVPCVMKRHLAVAPRGMDYNGRDAGTIFPTVTAGNSRVSTLTGRETISTGCRQRLAMAGQDAPSRSTVTAPVKGLFATGSCCRTTNSGVKA